MVVLALLAFSQLPAQSFNVKHLGEEDGLPSIDVYQVSQDSKGYMWICTESGVVRYDGYQCTFVRIGETSEHADVYGVHEDASGRIWFRTISGEMSFWLEGEIHNATNDSLCDQLRMNSEVLQIVEWEGRLYFISRTGGIKELDGKTVTSYESTALKNACGGPEGMLIVEYEADYVMDREGNRTLIDSVLQARYYSACLYHDSAYYVSYRHVLMRYQPGFSKRDTVLIGASGQSEIINLRALNDSILLISTRTGAAYFNSRSLEIEKQEMIGYIVTSFIPDQNGGFWYSTLKEGLFYDAFIQDAPNRLLAPSNTDRISCIYKDPKGDIWLGGERNTVFQLTKKGVKAYPLHVDGNIRFGRITKIGPGPDGEIYVLGKRVFARFGKESQPEVVKMAGNDFVLDKSGRLWLGSSMCYWEEPLKQTFSFTVTPEVFLGKRTNALALSGDTMLIGTNQGLYTFHEETGNFVQIEELAGYAIAAIELPYILTQRGRIFMLDDSGEISLVSSFPLAARCYSLLAHEDRIYLGTNKGVYHFYKETLYFEGVLGKVKAYDLEVVEDTLLVGSDKGLLALPMRDFKLEFPAPLLYLDSVRVNGELVESSALEHLSFRENAIQVYFTGILYPILPSYQYRINQEPWQPISTRELNLKLAPGNYRIAIQAMSGTDQMSEPLEVIVKIAPPFWQRPLFVLGCILLVSLGLIAGIFAYLRKIRNDHAQQRKLDQAHLKITQDKNRLLELEQQALRLQMNPHFLFNSINSIKGLYAQGKTRDAITYIHHFSNFLRVIVNNEDPLISLQKEVEILEHYLSLEKMKFPQMEFQIKLEDGLEPGRFFIPYMLIQPYAENAILHGLGPKQSKGTIFVRIQREGEGHLRIEVEDDGVGLDHKKTTPNKKSLGMRLTAERLGLFNGTQTPDIRVINNPNGPGVLVSFLTRYVYE